MNEQTVQPENEALSAVEMAEIRAEMAHYEDQSAVAVEALKIVQQRRRWVSDATLAALAEFLEMSPAQLDAVATFYNSIYRRPVGRQVIHYCNSVSCWMLGAEAVREQLCRRLGVRPGEMTADGEFTLLPAVCLGVCDHAPVLMADGELFLDVTENSIEGILQREQAYGQTAD
jgi:NADH-quinone oxidoreductase subunit E